MGTDLWQEMEDAAGAWIKHDLACPECTINMNSCDEGRRLEELSDQAEEAYDGSQRACCGKCEHC